jgi:predicted nucleic acid-binding protein
MTDDLLVDTNVLIHHWNGDPRTTALLDGRDLCISFVTEIEILGYHGYSMKERALVANDLKRVRIIDLSPDIKSIAIEFCGRHRLKLADALIAATAKARHIPLVTEDKHFKKLKEEILTLFL